MVQLDTEVAPSLWLFYEFAVDRIDMILRDRRIDQLVDVLAPQGKFALIDDPKTLLDIRKLKQKSISLHWELMFTRSLFGTEDMARQGAILARMARMVDDGIIQTTETRTLNGLSAKTLKEAHKTVESGAMIGKLVVAY